jgi:hypothetical protein
MWEAMLMRNPALALTLQRKTPRKMLTAYLPEDRRTLTSA